MKNLLVCIALGLFLCAGCGTTSDQRLAAIQTEIPKIQAVVAQTDTAIKTLQESLTSGLTALQDLSLSQDTKDQIAVAIAKTQAALLTEQAYKAKLEAWLTTNQAAIVAAQAQGSVSLPTEIGLLGTALQSGGSAIPGSAGGIVVLVGLLLSLAGNTWQKIGSSIATTKATATTKALTTIVNAVETLAPDTQATVKAAVGVRMASDSTSNGVIDAVKGS